MNRIYSSLSALIFLASCATQKPAVQEGEVARIIKTLSSDEMEGRAIFTPGIDRAARFIEEEFEKIGLKPLDGDNDFRQDFKVFNIKPGVITARIDGQTIQAENVFAVSDNAVLNFKSESNVQVVSLTATDQFIQKYREYSTLKTPTLVLVDQQHAGIFKRVKDGSSRGRTVTKLSDTPGVVFILGTKEAKDFDISISTTKEEKALFNVAGMLPGKSKEKELVLFSSHYDHLGVGKPVEGDSIFNGADDNASGTTAVIELARYYKKLNKNERTLIFVAFTGEESGGFGARYFSSELKPDDVTAMFNIEMIGKESKFGKNAAFITGYERSDFGDILQRNLADTDFTFHPDPYPD